MVITVFYGLHSKEYETTKKIGEALTKEKIPSTEFFDLRNNKRVRDILKENKPFVAVDIHGYEGDTSDWDVSDLITFITDDGKTLNALKDFVYDRKEHTRGVAATVINPNELGGRGVNTVDKNCLKLNIPYICIEVLVEPTENASKYLSKTLKFLVDINGC